MMGLLDMVLEAMNVPRRRVNQDAEEMYRDSSKAIAAASGGAPSGFCSVTVTVTDKNSDGSVLVPAAAHNQKHRASWDGVFSAPKSVSVQALVGDDYCLIDAHQRAVEKALIEVEKYALSRQRAGQESVVTGNVVAARFDHIAARPSENALKGQAPGPQLHTHVVFLNLTRPPDGQWRALDPQEIYRSQIYATAVYRAELARAVAQLGYRIAVKAQSPTAAETY